MVVSHTIGCSSLFRLRTGAHRALGRFIGASQLQSFISSEGPLFSFLKLSPHPNLPQMISFLDRVEVERDEKVADHTGSIMLFPEYLSDLHAVIKMQQRLCEDVARAYFFQLLSAARHLHKKGLAIRDIRLGKIMFADRELKTPVIADLRGACPVPPAGSGTECRTMSPAYVAPEVILHTDHLCMDLRAQDMWAFGVILFVMLAGFYPFSSLEPTELCRKIVANDYVFPEWMTPPARRFISRLLDSDPTQRLTVEQALAEPWLTGVGTPAPAATSVEPPPTSHGSDSDQVVPSFSSSSLSAPSPSTRAPSKRALSGSGRGDEVDEFCQEDGRRQKRICGGHSSMEGPALSTSAPAASERPMEEPVLQPLAAVASVAHVRL